jgi:hypothetical protein
MVMLHQLARYLMKRAAEVRSGKHSPQVTSIGSYLYKKPITRSSFSAKVKKREIQWKNLQTAFEHISRRLTLKAYDRLMDLKAKGRAHEIAWNENGIELMKVGSLFIIFLSCWFLGS